MRDPLPPLSHEDIAKLHTEVTQTVHQRFLLGCAAVTVCVAPFGQFLKDPALLTIQDLHVAAITAFIVTIVLEILHKQSQHLWTKVRTFTVYLRLMKASQWEIHWFEFRTIKDQQREGMSTLKKLRNRFADANLFAHRINFTMLHGIWALMLGYHWAAIWYNRLIPSVTSMEYIFCGLPILLSLALSFHAWRANRNDPQEEADITHAWGTVIRRIKQDGNQKPNPPDGPPPSQKSRRD
ncbi:MAG TPA: hypothetical protein VHS31_04525 [Tepidisphaeraceae bacterium]|jgi:hypothetical protein|nr:hypothetical protein [Tepidisphaeraceae bacterium]